MVRCKFVVNKIEEFAHGKQWTAGAVYSSDPNHENRAFAKASPSGTFTIQVDKDASGMPEMEKLRPGSEFYLDITPA